MTKNPHSTAAIAGHPLHPILVTLPIGLLIAAVAGFIDFLGSREIRQFGQVWLHFAGNAVVQLPALFSGTASRSSTATMTIPPTSSLERDAPMTARRRKPAVPLPMARQAVASQSGWPK